MPRPAIGSAPGAGFAQSAANAGIAHRTLLASGRSVRSKTELFRVLRDEEPGSGTFVSEADERTVEVHMGNLRRKLGDDPRRARWVETLRGVGYRMTGMAQRRNAVH